MEITNIMSSLLNRKILIFLIVMFIFGIFPVFVLVYSYYRDYTTSREVFITKQSEALEHYSGMITMELNDIFSDLEYLYQSSMVNNYLDGKTTKEDVEEDWLVFSRARGCYDQIRYINAEGMEAIRVDYNSGSPFIVAADDLQDKGGRYYFSMLTEFESPTILLSKIDLNIENGEIEQPFKPMLRISIPIYTESGIFDGALLLNYLSANILNRLQANFINNDYKVFCLKPVGVYSPGSR